MSRRATTPRHRLMRPRFLPHPQTGRSSFGVLGIAISLLLMAETGANALPKLAPRQLNAVLRGRVLVFSLPPPKDCTVRLGKAIGIAEGSSDALLHLILDVARYREYLPRIKASRFLRREGKAIIGFVEMSLPWPVSDAWCTYRLTYAHKGHGIYELFWTMKRGTLKRYQGHALIEPWNKTNDKAVITYELLVEPDSRAPTSLLSRGVRHSAEMFLHRVRIRIKTLKRQKKIPANIQRRYR
ncbi:MAG: hypothetical protein KAI47_19905 [Deltaproteobacteria bacterium]|nr:hypothetical protein [Deltaproteobacteria bacterium]